jgi:hypothetical protein
MAAVSACGRAVECISKNSFLLQGNLHCVGAMAELPNVKAYSANLKPTAILDIDHEQVRGLAKRMLQNGLADLSFLRRSHLHLVRMLSPVYSVTERQRASTTLEKRRGSCSQRMACLEVLARAAGIPTRVRAFRVKGSFWYPRFRLVRSFIPASVLLLWPQFLLQGAWLDFDELHDSIGNLVVRATCGFTNDGESLFEAVQNTPVDFCGKTCGLACAKPEYNLSTFVLADEGLFDSRDEALRQFGSFEDTWRGRAFELLFGDRKSS